MGKARILSAQGEGLYSIEILEDRTRAESLKQRALQRIDEIDSELTTLEAELEQARQAANAAAEAQDQAIDQHQAEILATGESTVDLQAPAQAVLEAAAARDAIRTRIGSLNLERLQQQGWIDRVDALPPLRTQQAWCADYTEDLDGEVATAEVPGEIGKVIIKPGFEDAATWNPSADGAIQPALAGTPASVFYNLAMMPGWQKWRPTFRIATISNINEDLCDITLDAATSSQQGLSVSAQGSYSGVPIYYMDCNGDAFEAGDRVLVAFSGQTGSPMVVGFEQEPKECDVRILLIPFNLEMQISGSYATDTGYAMPDGIWGAAWLNSYRLEADYSECLFYSGEESVFVASVDLDEDLPATTPVYITDARSSDRRNFPNRTFTNDVIQIYTATLYGVAPISSGISGDRNWSAIRPSAPKTGKTRIGGVEFDSHELGTFAILPYEEHGVNDESRKFAQISPPGQIPGVDAGACLIYPFESDFFDTRSHVISKSSLRYTDSEGVTWEPRSLLQPLDGVGEHIYEGDRWAYKPDETQYIRKTFYHRLIMRRV